MKTNNEKECATFIKGHSMPSNSTVVINTFNINSIITGSRYDSITEIRLDGGIVYQVKESSDEIMDMIYPKEK